MLLETGLSNLKKNNLSKKDCVFVARKKGNDELAPSEELLNDFMKEKQTIENKFGKGSAEAHNTAFLSCDYENRFRKQILNDGNALKKLEAIVKRSKNEDVYLICYEGPTKACHRRILLRIAEEIFGAAINIDGVEPNL